MDVFPVMGPVRGAAWGGPPKANSIRVRFLQRAGAWPLLSVDAGPTREGTPTDAPGGPPPTEARGFAASTIGPWAAWRQQDKKIHHSKRSRESSDSHRRSACGRLRTALQARADLR